MQFNSKLILTNLGIYAILDLKGVLVELLIKKIIYLINALYRFWCFFYLQVHFIKIILMGSMLYMF